jgi:hypothetical protein
VYCPKDSFTLEPGVRLRPVPEMGVCLAYTPIRPALHRLNAASWLVASMCDGRTLADIAADFSAALGKKAGSETALRQGIDQLLALGVIRRLPSRCRMGASPQSNSEKGGNQ